jgi:hypothetical protein
MRPTEMTEFLTLRAPYGAGALLNARAEAEGVSRSELVRRALAAYLAQPQSRVDQVRADRVP